MFRNILIIFMGIALIYLHYKITHRPKKYKYKSCHITRYKQEPFYVDPVFYVVQFSDNPKECYFTVFLPDAYMHVDHYVACGRDFSVYVETWH